MGFLSYLELPFKGFFRSINSYRFFNALEKSNTKKLTKLIAKQRSLFLLEEVYTGLSPFHVVIRENKEQYLPLLVSRPDAKKYINSQNNQAKWAPLHFAASNGQSSILSAILPLSPSLSIKTSEGLSAIHIAAGKGHADFLVKLLENGVHIDEKDTNEMTALHYSASQNHTETSQILIDNGAKTGISDKNGLTPLFSAVLHGHLESTQQLYKYKDGLKAASPLRIIHIAAGLQDFLILDWLNSQGEDLWQVDNSVIFT